jgi:hypothetical protein
LLLAAVIAGVLALHVLTAEDHTANPGPFGVSSAERLGSAPDHQHSAPADTAGAVVGAVSEPAGTTGSAWLGGCVLFLTAAAPGALALLRVLPCRRRRVGSADGAGPGDLAAARWVIPVPLTPRLAAGVIRV